MRVGATIEDKYVQVLRSVTPRLMDGMRQQMQEALKHYRNDGKPYRFRSRGLIETVNVKSGAWVEDRTKFCQAPGCGLMAHELGDDELKLCKACKEVAYCGKECQKADWKEHKKTCGKPKPTPAPRPASAGGIQMINV